MREKQKNKNKKNDENDSFFLGFKFNLSILTVLMWIRKGEIRWMKVMKKISPKKCKVIKVLKQLKSLK